MASWDWGEAGGGAASGAAIGTAILPGWGTAIGAAGGGLLGGLGVFGGDDPEQVKLNRDDTRLQTGRDIRTKAGDIYNRTLGRQAPQTQAAQAGATTINPQQQAQFRARQMALADQLGQQAMGQGPSVAGSQFKAAADTSLAQQQALAAGARGGNVALAGRQAAQNASNANQAFARDAATARIQEQISARDQLGGLLGQGRGQDIGLATDQAGLSQQLNLANAGLQQQSNLANMDANLKMAALNDSTLMAALAAQMGVDQAELTARMQQDALSIQQRNPGTEGMMGDLMGMGGSMLGAYLMNKKADGGPVHGPGGPKDDMVPLLASNGEYVIKADAANRLGTPLLDYINKHGDLPRYANGGPVDTSTWTPVEPWSPDKEEEFINLVKQKGKELSGTDKLITSLEKKQDTGYSREDINRRYDAQAREADRKSKIIMQMFARQQSQKDAPENGKRRNQMGKGLSSAMANIMPMLTEKKYREEMADIDRNRREELGRVMGVGSGHLVAGGKAGGHTGFGFGESGQLAPPSQPDRLPPTSIVIPGQVTPIPPSPYPYLPSDRGLKEKITNQTKLLDDFLDKLQAYSFDYKDPRHGEGRQHGIMAQDLERSEVGDTIVEEGQEGKVIDTRKAIGPILAALAHLKKSKKDK